MRYCLQEECNGLQQRVLLQTLTTVLFTVITETLFEKGFNRCSRRYCTPRSFAIIFFIVDVFSFLMICLLIVTAVEQGINLFKETAKQRCTDGFVKLNVAKGVVLRYLPVLVLGLCTSFLTLSVQEFLSRRKQVMNMIHNGEVEDDVGANDNEKTKEMYQNKMYKNKDPNNKNVEMLKV